MYKDSEKEREKESVRVKYMLEGYMSLLLDCFIHLLYTHIDDSVSTRLTDDR